MRPLLPILVAAAAVTLAPAAIAAPTTATVSTASVVHDGPGARFASLGTIERDRQVTVKGCNPSGRWCEIESDGKRGWVMARHLTTAKAAQPPEPARVAPPVNSDLPNMKVETPAVPAVTVETEKAGKGDKLAVPGKPVTVIIKSADGKVTSTVTVAAGSTMVVTASGRSHCELKVAVNP